MNRSTDILFRGKNLVNEWKYGLLSRVSPLQSSPTYYISEEVWEADKDTPIYTQHEVKKTTLGRQVAAKLLKGGDRTGYVFEGDVIFGCVYRADREGRKPPNTPIDGVVQYNPYGYFQVVPTGVCFIHGIIYLWQVEDIIVVGNIHHHQADGSIK